MCVVLQDAEDEIPETDAVSSLIIITYFEIN